jgi:hypothetical protein
MSGFRKFRTTLTRRRKAELLELGYLRPGEPLGRGATAAPRVLAGVAVAAPTEGDPLLGMPPSLEAQEIGPPPIAWLRTRKAEADH